MEAQDDLIQDQDGLAGEVEESLGEPKESANEIDESHLSQGGQTSEDPLYVQKRLKQQKRAHDREIRDLHARFAEMQSRMSGQTPTPNHEPLNNPYTGQPGIEEHIHKAVSYALQHKEMEERKAKEVKDAAHIQKQYNELQKHLDNMADKYDDFDDVVRGEEAFFTPHMRDAALLLTKSGTGSAGEVLYKLGKNPSELERISKLHPLDQAAEMVKLSKHLDSGGEQKNSNAPRQLGQIKNNPVTNSRAVTDKTPVSELRARMKAGWK